MALNILVSLIVLLIAVLWALQGKGRGLFSSLLTLVCVVVAGAIAFGLWETLVYSFLLEWREDLAWALGLAIPFALSLGVLRLAVEMLIPKNVKLDDTTNFVGGLVCGLGSGVITAGIVVIALRSVNFGPGVLGHEPINQDGGNLVYEDGLWVPVDQWTGALYAYLSVNSFSTGDEAMARRLPEVHEHVAMTSLVYTAETTEGLRVARSTLREGEASIASAYRGESLNAFLNSGTSPGSGLSVQTPDGEAFPPNSTMAGFVVRFEAGAREEGGQVVVGPGQVRLVYESPEGPGAVHPHAIISDQEVGGTKVWFPRKTKNLFVASVGGQSQAVMGFEFALPPGATPVDLIVKNLRLPVHAWDPSNAESVRTFASATQRDQAIVGGTLFAGGGGVDVATLDRSNVVRSGEGITLNPRLGGNRIINVTTGVPGSLRLNDENQIIGGQAEILNSNLANRGLARNNRTEEFGTTRDTQVLQVLLSETGTRTAPGRLVEQEGLTGRPFVIDDQGRTYDAVGYIYSDGVRTWIRYTPGDPLDAMTEVEDQLSITARDQTLILLFRPSVGVTLTGFAIGETMVAEFNQPVRSR